MYCYVIFIIRFCAEIQRENYPLDRTMALMGVSGQWMQPAHVISLLPAILIVNLLPVDVNFSISGDRGRILAGGESAVSYVS